MDSAEGDAAVIEELDVLVVGAGLSGIAAGYHLQRECKGRTYAILEARAALGGTWDLFRYPGIRSDSDMHTLGYAFRPWQGDKVYADGADILAYLEETAREYGIDRKIRYGHRVTRATWSSETARWTVEATREGGEVTRIQCRFLLVCSGYYDYETGHAPTFPGTERFGGRIVHPQKWTDDVDYTGKRVVVIGSGATAVTVVPAIARTAAHVTMLQRSPAYVVALPGRDAIARRLNRWLPSGVAYGLTRWKNIAVGAAVYSLCRRFPARAKRLLLTSPGRNLDKDYVDVHFTPRYDPWAQRPCFVPDGDLFEAIKEGRASVVTDHIETFTETGIRLASGQVLEADLVVTATGLKIMLLGGMTVAVDGRPVDVGSTVNYRGTMLSDVPNMAVVVGYTNASWTLKADLVCEFVCRLLNHMQAGGYDKVVPRASEAPSSDPIIDSTSGYVQRAIDLLPKQGPKAPWRLHQNYFLDVLGFRHGKIEDGVLELSRRPRAFARKAPDQPTAMREIPADST